MLERIFKFSQNGTTWRRDTLAGLTTFVVMSYIIVVNPAILGFADAPDLRDKGLPVAAALTSTCLVAGLMSILMGLYANRAYALAPAMGTNALVAYTLVGAYGLTMKAAMGIIVLEGLLITLLVLTGLRRTLFVGIPLPLKKAMAIGIGFFVLFIGLVDGGLVVNDEATFVRLGDLTGVPVAVTVFGLVVTIILLARGWRFAILIGIVLSTALAIVLNYAGGQASFREGVAVLPQRLVTAPDFRLVGAFDFSAFAQLGVAATVLWIFSIMLTDFFDTMGSLFGVGDAAGYLDKNGDLPDVHKPLLVDSLAAVVGGAVSASTATTYVESGAGVGMGGRTGWVSVVVGVLFLAAMPFSPVVAVVPIQATAPALIIVGYLMMRTITAGRGAAQPAALGRETVPGVDFGDFAFGLPAVLIITVMPLTYSITNGIGAGFIAYTLIRIAQGKARELGWVMWVATAGFVVYFAAPLLRQWLGG